MTVRTIHDTGRELRRIVRINEEIKAVVATALRINLMAMNAIFLAKRAGHTALGFGVLSSELRRFSDDLQQQMVRLREATLGGVSTVTALLRQTRINKILERTRAESAGTGKTIINEFMQTRGDSSGVQHRRQIAVLDRRLALAITETMQLVEMGNVLARSAKIEAAYGGTFAAALMQVSRDFEKIIAELRHSLERLGKYRD